MSRNSWLQFKKQYTYIKLKVLLEITKISYSEDTRREFWLSRRYTWAV
jgi:hypothetical protein